VSSAEILSQLPEEGNGEPEGSVRTNVIHTREIGEARPDLSRTEEDRVLQGLIVFLAERAEGARVSIPPGVTGSKVAGMCAHLVNAAAYKPRQAGEGVRSETGTVQVRRRNWRLMFSQLVRSSCSRGALRAWLVTDGSLPKGRGMRSVQASGRIGISAMRSEIS